MGERPGTLGAVALAACALIAAPAGAQVFNYGRTPVHVCFGLGALTFGSDHGGGSSPLAHEVLRRLPEGLAACEQAVKERPEGRLFARLARMRLLSGDGKGALEAARKAVELKSETGQVVLGVMQVDGVHLPRDYASARELFRLAGRWNMPQAHFNLGVMLANGLGVGRDDADAAAAFRRAALGRDPFAMQVFAQRYDREQAEMWLKKAAEAMDPQDLPTGMRIAELGRAAPDRAALLAWYEEKARAGEPWAQAYMGILYESGQWVRQDYAAAAEWYRKAGAAGHVRAQWRLASFYRAGIGVPRDDAEARRWSGMHVVQRCEALERDAAGANPCDILAADPHDPQKAVAGVDSACMRHFAKRAVAACSAAAKQSPSTARYRAQLARALAHVGELDGARREARKAAGGGSSMAMILMGVMEQRGLGAEKNQDAALAWYRQAAEAGDPRGAALFTTATGGAQVLSAPARTVRMAPTPAAQAAAGDPRAQHNLAAQLEREKKYDEAIQWYTRAAAQGFEASEMNLAQMYEKGIGVGKDRAEAMKRYRRLAGHGNAEARYRLARLAADAGQYDEALRNYEKGMRDDDYRALLDLGQLHEQGRGVPKDARRAVELYGKAAEKSAWARFKLGTMHLVGDGMPKDYAVAYKWLRRSADEDHHAGARNNIGYMVEHGLGQPVSYTIARDHYIGAVRGGNPQAKGNLEKLYAEGRGVPREAAARVQWYRPGAEAGISSAQYRLGLMYAKGEGVERNDAEAARLLLEAAHQGHREARKEAGELLYRMGKLFEAAALGHEGAARDLALKMAAAGQPGALEELLRRRRAGEMPEPPAPQWESGITLDPGEDQQRTMQVRVAGVATAHAAAANAAFANVYDIIRWFPETDGKKK